MIEVTETVFEYGDWHDVHRITCDRCGVSKWGIDVLVDAEQGGWVRLGAFDECPKCIAAVVRPTDA